MRPVNPSKLEHKLWDLFKKRLMLRSRDLQPLKIPRTLLAQLCQTGKIRRLGRGVYGLQGSPQSEYQSLLEVSTRVPEGVICLLSALHFHDIGTQIPHQVWLAIKNGARPPKLDTVGLRVMRFSNASLAHGVETRTINGIPIRATTPAKTIADCFKYRNKIGMDVALEALRDGWHKRRFTMDDLHRAATVDRVARVLRPYLEALV